MSVWESVEAAWRFVYDGRHLEVMRRRREWFTRLAEAHMALWWVPAGEIPTVGEARERIERIRAHGPTPHAFTFKRCFDPDGEPISVATGAERPQPCPA